MMTNLFTVFDPSTSQSFSLNWASSTLIILVLTPSIWLISSSAMKLMNFMNTTLKTEFELILGKKNKNNVIFILSTFLVILVHNFMGLMPYIFNGTSHMSVTLAIALPVWLGMNFYGWIYSTQPMFAHLLPQSTPGPLMPFMVLIESTSNTIRPLTLSVRLMANMVAGHLLMTLLGNLLNTSGNTEVVPEMITQMMLSTLELAVAIIQAYVFSVLSTLYINEIPSN